jgi:hypothetical protein
VTVLPALILELQLNAILLLLLLLMDLKLVGTTSNLDVKRMVQNAYVVMMINGDLKHRVMENANVFKMLTLLITGLLLELPFAIVILIVLIKPRTN